MLYKYVNTSWAFQLEKDLKQILTIFLFQKELSKLVSKNVFKSYNTRWKCFSKNYLRKTNLNWLITLKYSSHLIIKTVFGFSNEVDMFGTGSRVLQKSSTVFELPRLSSVTTYNRHRRDTPRPLSTTLRVCRDQHLSPVPTPMHFVPLNTSPFQHCSQTHTHFTSTSKFASIVVYKGSKVSHSFTNSSILTAHNVLCNDATSLISVAPLSALLSILA